MSNSYEEYGLQYERTYKKLIEQYGKQVDIQPPLTEIQWRATYNAATNEFTTQLRKGKIKAMPNITKYVVERQLYSYTDKQAEKMLIAARNSGDMNITLEEVKYKGIDWTKINEREEKLVKSGVKPTKAHEMVVAEFFYEHDQ